MRPSPGEVTRFLKSWRGSDAEALERLAPMVERFKPSLRTAPSPSNGPAPAVVAADHLT